ncbi:helix-turn-helix domain-containing protein [Paraeggerthella hongkongensis]|uniref:Helix-turn-helix domain-containing protein n=1 Tax=Paraeggerthella hongkongensis TaxID=230658 RepID=A0A3N0BJR4_9ACTN|nr:hypothetical protein DMP08_02685 [Paraeggerthella hongkongensis]
MTFYKSNKIDSNRSVYTVEDLAQIFGVSPQTIRLSLSSGELPGGFKCGRRWYVSEENLRRFMSGCTR